MIKPENKRDDKGREEEEKFFVINNISLQFCVFSVVKVNVLLSLL